MANRHSSDIQQHDNYWQERTARSHKPGEDDFERNLHQLGFNRPKTSLGVAGHVVHMAGVFVPLIAGELIESPQKYKKFVRLASIATAITYEGVHVYKEVKRREELEARGADCNERP